MKKFMLACMCVVMVAGCSNTTQQPATTPTQPQPEITLDKKSICTKELLLKLYKSSDKVGNEYFVLTSAPNVYWSWYLACSR